MGKFSCVNGFCTKLKILLREFYYLNLKFIKYNDDNRFLIMEYNCSLHHILSAESVPLDILIFDYART